MMMMKNNKVIWKFWIVKKKIVEVRRNKNGGIKSKETQERI